MATHVGLLISGGGASIDPYGSFYSLDDISQSTSGHASVSGRLSFGDTIPVGKQALVLFGAQNQYLLEQGFDFVEDANGHGYQPFRLDIYTAVAPSEFYALLAGYKVQYFQGTVANTCIIASDPSSDCIGTPAGWFDVTAELGNPVDTLRISVAPIDDPLPAPIPEPSSVLLAGLALAALWRGGGVRAAFKG